MLEFLVINTFKAFLTFTFYAKQKTLFFTNLLHEPLWTILQHVSLKNKEMLFNTFLFYFISFFFPYRIYIYILPFSILFMFDRRFSISDCKLGLSRTRAKGAPVSAVFDSSYTEAAHRLWSWPCFIIKPSV